MAHAALAQAREAAACGDCARALDRYEWFFDHALDHDAHALYGVRLSYCLHEWAELGSRHPEALERLRSKREEALERLVATRDGHRFHDFMSISEALGEGSPPTIEAFLDIHARDPSLAREIFRFVRSALVDAGHWQVASEYVPAPRLAYDRAMDRFEEAMKVCEENPDFGGEEFADQIRGWCARDLRDLWLLLANASRGAEADALREWVANEPRLAGHPDVARQAFEPPPGQ